MEKASFCCSLFVSQVHRIENLKSAYLENSTVNSLIMKPYLKHKLLWTSAFFDVTSELFSALSLACCVSFYYSHCSSSFECLCIVIFLFAFSIYLFPRFCVCVVCHCIVCVCVFLFILFFFACNIYYLI